MAEVATVTVQGEIRVFDGFGAFYLAHPIPNGLFSTSFDINSAVIFEVLPDIGARPFATATQLNVQQEVVAAPTQQTGSPNNIVNNNLNGANNGASAATDADAIVANGGGAVATGQAAAAAPTAAVTSVVRQVAPASAPITEPIISYSTMTLVPSSSSVLSEPESARTTIVLAGANPTSNKATTSATHGGATSADEGTGGLSSAAIAGIVIGVVAIVAIQTLLSVWLWLSHRRKKAEFRQRVFAGPTAVSQSRNFFGQSELSDTMLPAEIDGTLAARGVVELPSGQAIQDRSWPIFEKSVECT